MDGGGTKDVWHDTSILGTEESTVDVSGRDTPATVGEESTTPAEEGTPEEDPVGVDGSSSDVAGWQDPTDPTYADGSNPLANDDVLSPIDPTVTLVDADPRDAAAGQQGEVSVWFFISFSSLTASLR